MSKLITTVVQFSFVLGMAMIIIGLKHRKIKFTHG